MADRFRVVLAAGVLVGMLVALWMVFLYVPSEPRMGLAQRIFYFHVPAAVTAFIAFFIVFVASIAFLRTESCSWDRLASAAAELGTVFSLIVLITGPIWAKPVWGVYWRWEPRLTSMLVLFSLYVAYLMVRRYGTDARGAPRLAAVLGIVAFANVPLVYLSVNLWAAEQQLHPRRVELAPEMVGTLAMVTGVFVLLFVLLLDHGVALQKLAERLDDMREEVMLGEGPGPGSDPT